MSVIRSIYDEISITSLDGSKKIYLEAGTLSIDYFEDIFSPTITATLSIINTGHSTADRKNSVYYGLPIRGGEKVTLKVRGNTPQNPGLDFATNPNDCLYVSSVSNVIKETYRESFVLHLVSKEAITNEITKVPGYYETNSTIDTSAKSIIEQYLKPTKPITIDRASNTYGFWGNLRKPFTILVWLASKAIPDISKDGTAGFVFFQTRDGFYFRSIDKMILEKPKQTYTYTDVNKSSVERNNDYNILSYTVDRNQQLLENLRVGAYSTNRVYFDYSNFKFVNPNLAGLFDKNDYEGTIQTLGESGQTFSDNLPQFIQKSLAESPSRMVTEPLNIGTSDPDVTKTDNLNPIHHQSQSLTRYNTLFTQTLNMIVPSNTNLRAGDIIECKFPKVTCSDTAEFDDDISGLYMIKELNHHYDSGGSYTSMKLVRDTFGQNTKNSGTSLF